MKNGALISTVLNDLNIRSWREPTRDLDIKRGWREVARGWDDVISISISSNGQFCGLRKNGTLAPINMVKSQEKWNNLIAISNSNKHVFGLKKDGTIISSKYEYEGAGILHEVRKLHNIIAISRSGGEDIFSKEKLICVKGDGSVISLDYYYRITELDFKNVIMVSSSRCHTVGLKDNGTVVATGDNSDGQCNVQSWKLF